MFCTGMSSLWLLTGHSFEDKRAAVLQIVLMDFSQAILAYMKSFGLLKFFFLVYIYIVYSWCKLFILGVKLSIFGGIIRLFYVTLVHTSISVQETIIYCSSRKI